MVNKKEVILNPYLSFDVTLNTEFERYVPIVFLHGFKGFKDWGHYPLMAEDLAKKSALLAGKDNTLKKNSWLLIAHAKEMQGDTTGATEAESKAAGF